MRKSMSADTFWLIVFLLVCVAPVSCVCVCVIFVQGGNKAHQHSDPDLQESLESLYLTFLSKQLLTGRLSSVLPGNIFQWCLCCVLTKDWFLKYHQSGSGVMAPDWLISLFTKRKVGYLTWEDTPVFIDLNSRQSGFLEGARTLCTWPWGSM